MLGQNSITLDFTHNNLLRELEELIAHATPAEALLLLEKKTQLIGRQSMQWFSIGRHRAEPMDVAFRPSVPVQRLVSRVAQFLPH